MIGNAHIDPVWLWRWQEGFQEVKSTFRSALDRMEEYEDFLFTSSSAAFYEWVEKSDPGMFQEIRDRPLPKNDSYLSVEPDNVILEVLKQAEDGDDLIVRCRETCKKVTRATIYLSGWSRKIEADFAPCEIKTFRIPTDENLPVIETNLLEWDEPKL